MENFAFILMSHFDPNIDLKGKELNAIIVVIVEQYYMYIELYFA